jgi:hypothetical protein
MARITKALVPESQIAKERCKDGNKHSTKRILPMLTIADESPKAFVAAVTEYLAANKAICAGEETEIVMASGKVHKVTPKDATAAQAEGVTLLPNADLPITYADLVDAINKAVEALHRNQMGAWLTKTFTVPKAGAKTVVDGIVPDDETFA